MAAVTDLTALKSVHDVHVFLGIVNHMSKGSHAGGPPVGLGTTSMKGIGTNQVKSDKSTSVHSL